jgi:DNA repair exonuclease SbcCD nuclease subunit
MDHKIALISDIHFGVKSNSETFIEIIENFFLKTLKKVLEDRNITDVRILGDLFDNRNTLNIRTINSVLRVFKWYHKNMPQVKWKILLGNHDIYYHNRLDINSLEILNEFPNIEVISKVSCETLNNVKIITFPWLIEGSEADIKFKEINNSSEKYDLCLGHFEINGFEVASGILHEGGVDSGKFKNYNKVISGHFHLRRSNGHIQYLGCPYPITWSDYGDIKGIHVYDTNTKTVEFIENSDSPTFIRVDIEDLNDDSKLEKIKNNFVRMIVNKKYDDDAIIKGLSKLESIMPKKLDVENNFVESFDGELISSDIDLSTLNNPLVFLSEYIKNIQLSDYKFEKNNFIKYITDLYNNAITEKDNI